MARSLGVSAAEGAMVRLATALLECVNSMGSHVSLTQFRYIIDLSDGYFPGPKA